MADSTSIPKNRTFVPASWKALVHVDDLLKMPSIQRSVMRIEEKYRRGNKTFKAQAWWVLPSPLICKHFVQPQVIVTLVGQTPRSVLCYECEEKKNG